MLESSLLLSAYCRLRPGQLTINGRAQPVPEYTGDTGAWLGALYKQSEGQYPKFHKMDLLCKLGFLASEFCLKSAEGWQERHSLSETAIVLSNAVGSLDTDLVYQQSIQDKSAYFPSPAVFVYTLPNIVAGEIAIRHKITGENAFFVTEQFDADTLVDYTQLLFEQSAVEAVIAGWVNLQDGAPDALIYLVERPNDSIKNCNFSPHSTQSLSQLYYP